MIKFGPVLINFPKYYQIWELEVIQKRIASKNLECSECHRVIKKGELYIRDTFFIEDMGWLNTKTNIICLNCWKGPIPKEITRNKNWTFAKRQILKMFRNRKR